MGMECYLLRLHGNSSIDDVEADLAGLSHVERDVWPHMALHGERYYAFRDGRHVLEFELSPVAEGHATDISLRFALCHPDTIGEVFVAIATGLMTRLGFSATIVEDLPEGVQRGYSPGEVDAFIPACLWTICNARQQWQRQFGPELMGVSVNDACRFFFSDQRKNHAQ